MRILLSQTASLGDVILTTPLIAALKHKHPQAEIWFLTSAAAAALIKNDPRLTGIITYQKKTTFLDYVKKIIQIRKHKFDIVYAVQRSARVSILLALSSIRHRVGFGSSALPQLFNKLVERPKVKHDVLRNLAIAEMPEFDQIDLKLFVSSDLSIQKKFTEVLRQPYVAIAPGSLWKTKRWKAENFTAVSKLLKSKGIKSIFLGAPNEKDLLDICAKESDSISLAGKTDLQDMLNIISGARAVICNDSSSLHIASAFKIPTVAIFCATTADFGFGPWRNPKAVVLENKALWCRPCARHGGDFCPTGTELCMSASGHSGAITVEKVVDYVFKLIDE